MLKFFRELSLFLAIIFSIAFFWEAFLYFNEKKFLLDDFADKGKKNISKLAALIEKNAKNVKKIASDLVDEINTGEIPQKRLPQRLQEALNSSVQLCGIGVFFHPLSNDPEKRHKTPFYLHKFEAGSYFEDELVEVSKFPIFYTGQKGQRYTNGFVVADISRIKILELLNEVNLGQNAFSFILSGDGRYLAHPREELVLGNKTVFQEAVEMDCPGLFQLGSEVGRGNSGVVELNARKGGSEQIAFFETIPSTGWSIVTVYLAEPLTKPSKSMLKRLFRLIIELALCLTLLVFFREFKSKEIPDANLWIFSIAVSLIFVLGTFSMWFLTLNYRDLLETNDIIMTDPSVLARFKTDCVKESKKFSKRKPVFIPTGLFLRTIEFTSAVSVRAVGTVWQRLPKGGIEGVSEGIFFPEAVDTTMEKAYEREESGEKIIGWNFKAEIREPFYYHTFPFDLENIWLRIWPTNYDSSVVLVPDFSAYETMNPKSKPGLDNDLLLPGWFLKECYFSYFPNSYNMNFGLKHRSAQEKFHELYFNLIVRRNFLDPFISSILPVMVVLILIFSVLLIHTKLQSLISLFGFSAGVTIQVSAALFFVITWAQIDLRTRLAVETIMYMDCFYFLTYLVFLIASVDSILYCWTDKFVFLQYKDHLFAKILYWPVTSFCVFCITIRYFYP
ncbi:MAG: cache domain-containing protein [Candidatus Riflebacteria bacterium]|nr:cache domain-containing protein [Candidatus Riflebacteria bacterium]